MTKRLKDDWELYEKTTRPDESVRLRVLQAYHSGAVAMYQLMLDAVFNSKTQDELVNAMRTHGQDAGAVLLGSIPQDELHRTLYEMLGGGRKPGDGGAL